MVVEDENSGVDGIGSKARATQKELKVFTATSHRGKIWQLIPLLPASQNCPEAVLTAFLLAAGSPGSPAAH